MIGATLVTTRLVWTTLTSATTGAPLARRVLVGASRRTAAAAATLPLFMATAVFILAELLLRVLRLSIRRRLTRSHGDLDIDDLVPLRVGTQALGNR